MNTVERLTENRQIERAKSILESNGYKVAKIVQESKESSTYRFGMDFDDEPEETQKYCRQYSLTYQKGKGYPGYAAYLVGPKENIKDLVTNEFYMDWENDVEPYLEVVNESRRIRGKRLKESTLDSYVVSLAELDEPCYDGFISDAEEFIGVSADEIYGICSEDEGIDIEEYEKVQDALIDNSKVIKSRGAMGCVFQFRESPKYGRFINTAEMGCYCLYAKSLPLDEKVNESRSPEIEKMMDYIDEIQGEYYHLGDGDKFEEILMKHHASEDDNDDDEGYFSTMSDDDIRAAYNELKSGSPDDADFKDVTSLLLSAGFEEKVVENPEGSVYYYTKGSVGVLISEVGDIKIAAKNLL